jgi:putative CocE/NonD family hydrolase
MRDGTELAAILWRPKGEGPWPVLVERCPHRLVPRSGDAGIYHAGRGIAVLSVGLRGCAGSGGDFSGAIPGSPSGDGYDTVEWAAAQAWCNGQVGMICGSISGGTAYQTATEAPPHLLPLFVREGTVAVGAPSAQVRQLIGMQLLAMAWTEERLGNFTPEQRARAERLLADWKAQWHAARAQVGANSPLLPVPAMAWQLPLTPNTLFRGIADYYNELMAAPEQRPQEMGIDLSRYADQVRVPIYHLAGWYDSLIVGNLAMFAALRQRAATAEARCTASSMLLRARRTRIGLCGLQWCGRMAHQ